VARKTLNQIVEQILGPAVGEPGLMERKLRAELALAQADGLIDFHVTFGELAETREQRAAVALEALTRPAEREPGSPPVTGRSPVNLRELVAGLPA